VATAPTPIDLAYLAGFFDGEGCVRAREDGHIGVVVSQVGAVPLSRFQELFGGNVRELRRPASPLWRSVSQWALYGRRSINFLEAVLPYLTVKAEQARLAIQLQRLIPPIGAAPGGQRTRGYVAVGPWERAERDSFVEALHIAKRMVPE
jgi:hypothetical protein